MPHSLIPIALFFALLTSPICAQIYVDAGASGANNGSSWVNAHTKLQDAIARSTSGQTIHVAEGTYYPDEGAGQLDNFRLAYFELKSGVRILGGFPSGGGDLSSRDSADNETILSGDIDQNDSTGGSNSLNTYNVLKAYGTDALALLDGFTITAGNAHGPYYGTDKGGALNCSSNGPTFAVPSIVNCTFRGNSGEDGGAVHNSYSSPSFTNCSFQGNVGNDGGAIFNRNSSPSFTNCTFEENSAVVGDTTKGHSGAMVNYLSSPTLTDCSFLENSSEKTGGACSNVFSSPILSNCSFQRNSAGSSGGAIDNLQSSPTLTNCSFVGNSATTIGGAIRNGLGSPAYINCSFQGNSADIGGGAIENYDSTPTLTNCIVWNNVEIASSSTPGASILNAGTSVPSYSNCILQNLDLTGTGTGNLDGTDPTNDPLFFSEVDPLAPVAQRTGGDLRLPGRSPLLGLGDSSANPTTTDLAGNPRKVGSIDLGAYEQRGILYVRASDGNDSDDGSDWDNAFATVQQALSAAIPDQDVWVAGGTYYPDEGVDQVDGDRSSTFALESGVGLYGGFSATGTPLFSDRDPTLYQTILSGDIDQNDGAGGDSEFNAYHVLTADGIDASAALDGFSITAGNANNDFYPDPSSLGGGLYCSGGTGFTLANCSFQGNSADQGGAIYSTSSSLSLIHCSFMENSASGGGAIYNDNSSSLALTNCMFQANVGDNGGVVFSSNSSSSLTSCLFEGNSAGNFAGAIYNDNSPSTLINCSLQGNAAGFGAGAMYNGSSSVSLTNCSFQGNSGDYEVGAIYNDNSPATLVNCIIWNNAENGSVSAPGASIKNTGTSMPSYSHCLIQNFDLSGTGGSNLDGTDTANDPRFVSELDPLLPVDQRTGGDLSLHITSPLLGIGDSSSNPITTDLAGNPRKIGIIDLGAYEQRGIIYVRSSDGNDSNNSSDWNNAFKTLQKALSISNLGQEIWVAENTYYPDEGTGQANDDPYSTFSLKSGVKIYGGFADTGNPVFAERNPSLYETILSGDIDKNDSSGGDNANNAYNVMTADGSDALALLDGFTITAGNAYQFPDDASGGALYCTNSAALSLANCSFRGNSADRGGAIYNLNSSPTLINCSFEGNSSGGGGAITNFESSPTLTHCSFLGNVVNFDSGGAISNQNSSSPTLTHCSFQGNSASRFGGAILNFITCSPTLTNCTFQENSADTGGAIYSRDSSPTITNCSFQRNSADNGGAIFNNGATTPPTITNCIFQGNSASTQGGAIYSSYYALSIINCSLQGNSATEGGAIYHSNRSLSLTNCILWNNAENGSTSVPGASISITGSSPPTYSNCLFQNINPTGTDNLDGTDAANTPRFVSEVDPLAPVAQRTGGNLRLLLGSAALDAGLDSANTTTSDLAGNPRKSGTIDLGAYEGEMIDYAALWPTDYDFDQIPWGLETTLGTDPETANAPGEGNLMAPTFNGSGQAEFSFARNPNAPAGTVLKLMRSTSLEAGSFIEILSLTPTSTEGTFTEDGDGGSFSGPANEIFSFFDHNPPNPKAFYRLQAESPAPLDYPAL